jgi:hypothetical protein
LTHNILIISPVKKNWLEKCLTNKSGQIYQTNTAAQGTPCAKMPQRADIKNEFSTWCPFGEHPTL